MKERLALIDAWKDKANDGKQKLEKLFPYHYQTFGDWQRGENIKPPDRHRLVAFLRDQGYLPAAHTPEPHSDGLKPLDDEEMCGVVAAAEADATGASLKPAINKLIATYGTTPVGSVQSGIAAVLIPQAAILGGPKEMGAYFSMVRDPLCVLADCGSNDISSRALASMALTCLGRFEMLMAATHSESGSRITMLRSALWHFDRAQRSVPEHRSVGSLPELPLIWANSEHAQASPIPGSSVNRLYLSRCAGPTYRYKLMCRLALAGEYLIRGKPDLRRAKSELEAAQGVFDAWLRCVSKSPSEIIQGRIVAWQIRLEGMKTVFEELAHSRIGVAAGSHRRSLASQIDNISHSYALFGQERAAVATLVKGGLKEARRSLVPEAELLDCGVKNSFGVDSSDFRTMPLNRLFEMNPECPTPMRQLPALRSQLPSQMLFRESYGYIHTAHRETEFASEEDMMR